MPETPEMPQIIQLDNAALAQLKANQPQLQLIDVRSPGEYHGLGHIPGARLMPLQQFAQTYQTLSPAQPVAITCEHGVRSMAAAEWLVAQGYSPVYNLTHGMAQWSGERAF
ncbi:MAG: rhodanese-like domain-containing protein [Vampirovibrionales bacterium]|nr:rhodanese-like domain-containing protein [Vampirovibrionales bacterium]